jgi:sterol desaturase/sphingolipid hydroxylase (fatty acid hydroxylase superfamily)
MLARMGSPSLVNLIIGFIGLAVVVGAIERLFPAIPGVTIFARKRLADFLYWLLTPMVSGPLSRLSVVLVMLALAGLLGVPGHGAQKLAALAADLRARSPLAALPDGQQLVVALLISDFLGYFWHRLFHHARLWRFHAIHHSSEQLDWLSATRLHPLNDVLSKLVTVVPILLCGVQPRVFTVAVPVLTLYAIFVHANVRWGFGPLKYVIVTPLFHRWHHTSQDEGLDKNFAGLCPIYDLLFGTFYMPAGRQPVRFGIPDSDVPAGFLGQLAYPFRRPKVT